MEAASLRVTASGDAVGRSEYRGCRFLTNSSLSSSSLLNRILTLLKVGTGPTKMPHFSASFEASGSHVNAVLDDEL